MKRTSIVGPLILIGIGVLFLARNLNPNLPVLDWLARFWPFLLIGWGVLRLGEVLYWKSQNRPLPASGVSGGEWALVVFLCLFGTGVAAYNNAGSWWRGQNIRIGGLQVFGESYEYPVEGRTQAGKAPKVIIESFRGNARIHGADTEEVAVAGRKTIRALQPKDAEQASQNTPLEVVRRGDEVIIRTYQERLPNNVRIEADLEITVPRGASIEARGRRGDFDINDIAGSVDIDSDNAGVRLNNIGGSVKIVARASDILKAENVKGGVEIRGSRGSDVVLSDVQGQAIIAGSFTDIALRNLAKPVRYESSQTEFAVEKLPGEAHLDLGEIRVENAVGPVRLKSKSRDVRVSDFTGGLDLSIERGDIEVRPAGVQMGAIDIRTRSGDIDLVLPSNAKFDLTAITERGDVTNDYGQPLAASTESGEDKGGRITGQVGAGPKITANTRRGLISVRKGDAVTSLPAPKSVRSTEDLETPPDPAAPPKAPRAPKTPKTLAPPIEQ